MEKIEGQHIADILTTIKKDKTLIKMRLTGKNYECLTIITNVYPNKKNRTFMIDSPKDFQPASGGLNNLKMNFKFTGKDNLSYSFKTSGGEIHHDEIKVNFPDFINRKQRRKDFRLEVPAGTKLHVRINSKLLKMNVIDVSLGGTLIALVGHMPEIEEKHFLKVGDCFEDIELLFPLEGKFFKSKIKKATIVRAVKGSLKPKNCCALQFVSIDKNEQKSLTKFIYKYQQQLLRKRIRLNL
ncbi:MAG: PilZ domain-containing protein [Thermodesulfobacteriota bacterium]|nr:PilZ domain-containing protein [Thermodesulfobacteriota bacterium]